MRKLGLALAFLLALGPAWAQPVIPLTQFSIPVTISTNTTTLLINGSPNKSIYVTSAFILAGGTGAIQFIAGTGATCQNTTVNITGNISLAAQVGFTMGNGSGVIWVVPAGDSLCAVTSQAVGMPGSLSYAQF